MLSSYIFVAKDLKHQLIGLNEYTYATEMGSFNPIDPIWTGFAKKN